MHAHRGGSVAPRTVLDPTSLFPFRLSPISADQLVAVSGRLDMLRHDWNDDSIFLRHAAARPWMRNIFPVPVGCCPRPGTTGSRSGTGRSAQLGRISGNGFVPSSSRRMPLDRSPRDDAAHAGGGTGSPTGSRGLPRAIRAPSGAAALRGASFGCRHGCKGRWSSSLVPRDHLAGFCMGHQRRDRRQARRARLPLQRARPIVELPMITNAHRAVEGGCGRLRIRPVEQRAVFTRHIAFVGTFADEIAG